MPDWEAQALTVLAQAKLPPGCGPWAPGPLGGPGRVDDGRAILPSYMVNIWLIYGKYMGNIWEIYG